MSLDDMIDFKEVQIGREDEVDLKDSSEELWGEMGQHKLLFYDELLDAPCEDIECESGQGICDSNETRSIEDRQELSLYNEDSERKLKPKELTCGHCGYMTVRKREFKSHLRKHIRLQCAIRKGPQRYKCDECSYSTTSEVCLKRHAAMHKRIVIKLKLNFRSDSLKPARSSSYMCKQCNFTTKRWKDFKLHIPKHDPLDAKVYKCDLCDFTTKWRQNLKPHVETHKSRQAVEYKCDLCDYTTKLKRYLTQHYQRHKSSKQFKCRLCRFSTNWRKNLKQHMEVHNSAEAYRCDDCGFATNSKRNLKIHFKRYGGSSSHAKPY